MVSKRVLNCEYIYLGLIVSLTIISKFLIKKHLFPKWEKRLKKHLDAILAWWGPGHTSDSSVSTLITVYSASELLMGFHLFLTNSNVFYSVLTENRFDLDVFFGTTLIRLIKMRVQGLKKKMKSTCGSILTTNTTLQDC